MIPGSTNTRRPRGLRRVAASLASCDNSRYSPSPKYALSSPACAPERSSATIWSSCKSPMLGMLVSGISCSARHRRLDRVAHRPDGVCARGALAPHGTDGARRDWLREFFDRPTVTGAEWAAGRKLGQQRDAETCGDHLSQRFQARCAIVLAFLHVDAAAHIEGLIAQAVALFEQQQRLICEIVDLHVGALGERIVRRHCNREGLLVQRTRLQAVERHRHRENSPVAIAPA